MNIEVTANDFLSLDEAQLLRPRLSDGSLPDIDFLKLKTSSVFYAAGMGYFYTPLGSIVSYDWIEEPTIIVEHKIVPFKACSLSIAISKQKKDSPFNMPIMWIFRD
ncbi:DUF4990 domain-containing protein [Sphingobacterium sp. FBM7-1]|nr:DUF4990 domain-containing protein [Sphingobacterium sp. FBM7-1]